MGPERRQPAHHRWPQVRFLGPLDVVIGNKSRQQRQELLGWGRIFFSPTFYFGQRCVTFFLYTIDGSIIRLLNNSFACDEPMFCLLRS